VAATLQEGSDTAPLSSVEADRLAELERVVAQAIGTAAAAFMELGLALGRIRDERLFAVTDDAFKTYVERRWGLGYQWAYALIYAARVADAISTRYVLPAGIAPGALKPLVPLLNREGPEAVAAAWAPIAEACNGRPPSRGDVRAALVAQGLVTTAPEKPSPVQLRTIEAGLVAAEKRLEAVRERAPLAPAQRDRAARCADVARRLVEGLEMVADVRAARAELAVLEPAAVVETRAESVADVAALEGERCECPRPLNDGTGDCVKCGREIAWRPRMDRIGGA
jgi:hypothetical protein